MVGSRKRKSDDQRTPAEAERERDAILKRMLQTKPKQQKDMVAERKAQNKDRGKARR